MLALEEECEAMALNGMLPAWHARRLPNDIALFSARGNLTFRELDVGANRFAQGCRDAGLAPGNSVATVMGNVPEFVQVLLGCMRSGLRLTPVSWRLEPHIISHILKDCGARAIIVQPDTIARMDGVDFGSPALGLSVGKRLSGFRAFEDLQAWSGADPESPRLGEFMLYTSGTTGPPKGVRRARARVYRGQGVGTHAGYRAGDINLLCGPAYHGAPLYHDLILPLVSGIPVVMVEKFDPQLVMELIERFRITHTHMVPTMFHRLLSLPTDVRDRYDLSSLRQLNHGAAPTAPAVKHAMIEWLGPILSEYYASTEGGAGMRISSAEWLRKPGSVGKVTAASRVRILDDAGRECPAGVVGRVFLQNGADGIVSAYHNNPAETDRVFSGTHFTVGDLGSIDAGGYLFLKGRTADRIISGGVNIQPQEIDDVLAEHPDVFAVGCVGVPHTEWGEEVRAVVVARPEARDLHTLEKRLLVWAAERLAGYKVPRQIDFVDSLPFSDAGKLLRGELRKPYWRHLGREI